MMRNDRRNAVLWPKEHWHVAVFICACVVVAGAMLAYLGWLSERAATAAVLASIVYVVITTWQFTRPRDEQEGKP